MLHPRNKYLYSMARPPFLLIVDDDPINHAVAGAALSAAGWRVDRADNGEAGIAIARDRRYALILMDLQMPGIDGFETARTIRSGGASASAPILAFTAQREADIAGPLKVSGMDGLVAKPFAPDMICAAAALWRPEDAPPPATKLAAIFGATEIAALLDGLRAQLEDILACSDGDALQRGRAHRLAGIAGTLGFPRLSALWLAVSEGDDTACPAARISARKALARIAAVDS